MELMVRLNAVYNEFQRHLTSRGMLGIYFIAGVKTTHKIRFGKEKRLSVRFADVFELMANPGRL